MSKNHLLKAFAIATLFALPFHSSAQQKNETTARKSVSVFDKKTVIMGSKDEARPPVELRGETWEPDIFGQMEGFRQGTQFTVPARSLSTARHLSPLEPMSVLQKPDGQTVMKLANHVQLVMQIRMTNVEGLNKGMYAMDPVAKSSVQLSSQLPKDFTGGSQIKDGKYYGVTQEANAKIYRFDATTWDYEGQVGELSGYDKVATETATAADGTVYGEFFETDQLHLFYGIIDYATGEVTRIGSAKKHMLCLGITKAGRLYGIAKDGNLYEVSTKDGSEKLVGSTGVDDLITRHGRFYDQTGEIDPRDDTFYWLPLTRSLTSTLYTVDLGTGKATPVYEFEGGIQAAGMAIALPEKQNTTPEAISDLNVTFDGLNTRGQLEFTAPSTTYNGTALAAGAELFYHIYVTNGNFTRESIKIEKNYTLPGKKVAVAVEDNKIQNDALNTFEVTASVGESGEESLAAVWKVWVGRDEPLAPLNAQAMMSADGKKMTITWSQPEEKGVHGGYVKLSELKYNIYIIRDGGTPILIATDKTVDSKGAGKYDHPVADDMVNGDKSEYVFAVEAVNNGNTSLVSEKALTDGTMIGVGQTVPYVMAAADGTMVDANEDDRTWELNDYGTPPYWRYVYHPTNAADDWLFTKPVALKKGKKYVFSMDVRGMGASYPERIEVKAGVTKSIEAMTQEVISATDVTWRDYTSMKAEVEPTEDVDYYFGIHAISDAYQYYLYVQNVTVTDDASAELDAPAAPTGLVVAPVFGSNPVADVAFNVPALNRKGDALKNSQAMTVELLRDGTLIQTWTNQRKGTTLTFTDDGASTSGSHTYTAVAILDGKRGDEATATAFLGTDVLLKTPSGVKAEQTDNALVLTWDEPDNVGVNGGWVPTPVNHVVYNQQQYRSINSDLNWGYSFASAYRYAGDPIADANYDKNVKLADLDPNEGQQQGVNYYVTARAQDNGNTLYADLQGVYTVIGQPAELPAIETGAREHVMTSDMSPLLYMVNSMAGDNLASVFFDTDLNGDNSSISYSFQSPYSGWISIEFDKLNVKDAANPVLTFDAYLDDPEVELQAVVQKPNGDNEVVAIVAESTDIQQLKVDLSKYKMLNFIRLRFIANFNLVENGTNQHGAWLDNVWVFDGADTNLAVIDISSPANLYAGKTGVVSAKVINLGDETVNSYTVRLLNGSAVAEEIVVDEPLAPKATKTVTFRYTANTVTTSSTDVSATQQLTATVEADGDTVETDNSLSTTISVSVMGQLDTDAPYAVVAEEAEDGASANIVWSFTATPKQAFVEDFEDTEMFQPWSLGGIKSGVKNGQLGDWKLYDGDNMNTYTWDSTDEIQNATAPQAFQVIDGSDAFFNANMRMEAHSGNQYLMSMDPADGNYRPAADDWLISPALRGGTTVSFWYRANASDVRESFDVLLSEDSQSVDDFTGNLLGSFMDNRGEWTRGEVSVPVGADGAYVAFHHNEGWVGAVGLMIDDIAYTIDGSVDHFNIYMDGKLAGQVNGDTYTFTTAEGLAPGDHQVAVTAVYADGIESAPGYAALVTGIDGLLQSGRPFDVYALDGKLIRRQTKSVAGLKGIYVINNRKVVLK